jgi:outer membrane biosynthesis protein TonB
VRNSYVVTTSIAGNRQTRVWDAATPFALGHPFQWVIETTSSGIRVRDLSGKLGELQNAQMKEITFDALEKGAEIKLPKFTLTIKPVVELDPVFGANEGKTLKAFTCVGNWVMQSRTIDSSYTARIQKKAVFFLARQGDGYSLRAEVDNLQIDGKPVAFGETAVLKPAALAQSTISWGTYNWRFGTVDAPTLTEGALKDAEPESEWFKRSVAISAMAFAVFLALSWLWPKPAKKEDELIPPQFTKIVMMKPKAAAASAAATETAQAVPKKAEQTAIAQAFRAKALQSNLSGLLKGGMTKLLAQSDFTTGSNSDAKKLFNSKSDSLRATATNVGLTEQRDVKVAAIGGAAGAAGAKAGYGKGEHAGVKGQGESFVSMDIAGSTVDEGLTKDQVGEVIHRHLSEIRYCYESAMVRSPDIEGKLVTAFVIGGNGKVKSTEVTTSTLPDPRLDDCVLRRLVTWQFPLPRGGVDVAVSYPFIFKTLGR